MRSFIVVGGLHAQQAHLSEFIKSKSIPKAGVFEYPETLKIADVRAIKAQLSMYSGIRLFVFHASATVAAQNAMLKSLEELPEDTFVIFFVKRVSDLLLTIQSRATIVRLGVAGESLQSSGQVQGLDFSSEDSLLAYLKGSSRELRLGNDASYHTLSMLTEVFNILPLVESNNLSPKMASDYINFQIEEMRS